MTTAKNSNTKKTEDRHIWALLGPEIGRKQRELKSIITTISKTIETNHGNIDSLQKVKFFIGDTDASAIEEEILSPSLFFLYKIIIIEALEIANAADSTKNCRCL